MADASAALTNQVASNGRVGVGVLRPLKAAEVVYKGTLGIITAGYVLDGTDSASSVFAGVFAEDKTGGATDGLTFVRMWLRGIFAFTASNGAATDLGKDATMVDNQGIDLAAVTTNDIIVGKIVGWQVSGVNWVKFATGAKALIKIDGAC